LIVINEPIKNLIPAKTQEQKNKNTPFSFSAGVLKLRLPKRLF